jgi:hypothetical protein
MLSRSELLAVVLPLFKYWLFAVVEVVFVVVVVVELEVPGNGFVVAPVAAVISPIMFLPPTPNDDDDPVRKCPFVAVVSGRFIVTVCCRPAKKLL